MHSHLAKMLGQYILDERNRQDILQRELAEDLNMSAQFLGRIEKGEVMIPDPSLRKVIRVLDLHSQKLTKIYRCAADLEVESLFKSNKKRKRA